VLDVQLSLYSLQLVTTTWSVGGTIFTVLCCNVSIVHRSGLPLILAQLQVSESSGAYAC